MNLIYLKIYAVNKKGSMIKKTEINLKNKLRTKIINLIIYKL